MDRRIFLTFALLGALALSFLGSACAHRDPADSSLPWGRPAAWENTVPGFDY